MESLIKTMLLQHIYQVTLFVTLFNYEPHTTRSNLRIDSRIGARVRDSSKQARHYCYTEICLAPGTGRKISLDGRHSMEKVSIIYDIETTALQPFDHDARITAIGIKTDSQEIIITHEDEKCILENFWGFLKQFDDFRLIGFNNFGFDSQWLIIRSFKHNIPIVEFSHKSVDLRYVLSNGKVTKGTLEDFSLLISNNGKHKGMKGSTAIELWRNNNIQELKEYLLNDVRMTYTIFQRLQSIGVL